MDFNSHQIRNLSNYQSWSHQYELQFSPAEMNPGLLARDNQRLEVGVEVSGQEGSSACLEEEMNSTPSLVSAGSSSVNFKSWQYLLNT